MLNLVVKKEASEDRDRRESSITRTRTGTPIGFVQRSRLDFGLGTSSYRVEMFFFFFFIFFFIIFFYCSSFDIIDNMHL